MKKLVLLSTVLTAVVFAYSQSDVYIGLTSRLKPQNKIKIAINKFKPYRAEIKNDAVVADTLEEIVRADLLFSRYFEIDERNIEKPDFDILYKQGVDYLLDCRAAYNDDGWMLKASVTDIQTEKVIARKYYKGKSNSIRRGGHVLSDYLVWKLTGKQGIAKTRIAFANDSTKKKEIYVADYDGGNLVRLTNDGSIALLPKWSPDGNKIYYTTYKNKNPDLYEINLVDKTSKPVSSSRGINLPGGISPDGGKMVLTLSRGQDPNIYLLNFISNRLKKLTHRSSIESSASFSPDGRFITFISDRSGNPQVHIMELRTGKIEKLTRFNWCDSPRWSPRGEWIVFAGRIDKSDLNMDIFLVDITGLRIRRLTKDAGSNEDPSWSPDGRFIAFTSNRNGTRQIFVMDSDGSASHLISRIGGNSYTPGWSP